MSSIEYLLSYDAGPFFEARDYVDFIERKGVWAAPLPPPYLQGMLRLLKGVLCVAFHLTMIRFFPVSLLETAFFLRLRLPIKCAAMQTNVLSFPLL